jgi:GlpG protein
MRKIGSVSDRAQGEVLGAYLVSKGIPNRFEPSEGGQWVLWICADEDLAAGRVILDEFSSNPEDPKFTVGAAHGQRSLREEDAKDQRFRRNYYDHKRLFKGLRFGLVTVFLVGLSVVVTLLSNFDLKNAMADELLITSIRLDGIPGFYNKTMPEVRAGEVWRLVTPIFLHLGVIHLLFNMMWLYELGNMIERRHGSLLLLAFVFLIAIPSNVLQFVFTGPTFGGMSGVVYGLLGYLWIRAKTDPFYEIHLQRNTIIMMGIWLVLCILLPQLHVANIAHCVGLLVGAGVGYLFGMLAKRKRFGD